MFSKKQFLLAARERLQKSGELRKYVYTRHAEYKMREYRLSRQKVEGVIRRPARTEEGIAKDTLAVMQPVSPKTERGKQIWKQEVWVMYQFRHSGTISNFQSACRTDRFPISQQIQKAKFQTHNSAQQLRIISVWRYPGVSPKRNPIPESILREIEEGSMLEESIINE